MAGKSGVRPPQLKALLRREVGDASRTLRAPDLTDEDVHRARKGLKRARANLRLLRPALGARAYARENAALRDAARPFSSIRDAKVMLDTLEALLEREQNAARRALLTKLRAVIDAERLAAREKLHASGAAAGSAETLERAWRRIDRRRVPERRAALLRDGLRRIYRRGRKALASADRDRTPENLHEWRKHTKYLANAVASLGAERSQRAARLVKRIEALADALGHDHDLVVFEHEVKRLHRHSNARAGLFQELAARRDALQAKALKQGRKIFGPTPRAFVKRLRTAVTKL